MLTIAPLPLSTITGITAWQAKKVPFKLTLTTSPKPDLVLAAALPLSVFALTAVSRFSAQFHIVGGVCRAELAHRQESRGQ